jgi:hypothetical protein
MRKILVGTMADDALPKEGEDEDFIRQSSALLTSYLLERESSNHICFQRFYLSITILVIACLYREEVLYSMKIWSI